MFDIVQLVLGLMKVSWEKQNKKKTHEIIYKSTVYESVCLNHKSEFLQAEERRPELEWSLSQAALYICHEADLTSTHEIFTN